MTLKITPTNIVLKIVFVFLLFSLQINAQSILNNGQRRIGSGSENSINASGNMQQPFYYNNAQSTWSPLTYSNYPLDIRWGVGGDGTNNWNITGNFADNPTLSNIVYDYSGFTPITNTATRNELGGTGEIKVSGNITVNSQLFLIENSYTLGSTDGFFRVKTKITNQSGSTATNVRLWVGTRDDWIGQTDQPTKERGNLVDGAFTIIPTQATQAKAIKVYSGDEAILMFSNSPRAYSTIAGCCNFTNATNQNPATNTISVTNDGSYAVYARFNDLASNQSDELDWYYAAGTIAEITEIIRKVAEAASAVSNITHNSADYSYSATQSGTTSYVLVPAGSTVPTAAQVEAGVSYTGGTVISSSSIASVANTAHIYNFTGLIASTNYTIYAVTRYNDGVSDVFTSVQTTNFATIAQPTGLTKHGEITTDAAKIVNSNGGIGTGRGLNIFGKKLDTPLPIVKDGLSSSTAGTSAKQIKTDYESSPSGIYWISNPNINSGTPFQIYADMTTDGGGWMLLNVGAGPTTVPESTSVTSPNDLGYLPRNYVIQLANLSTDVQLRSGNSSTSYAHKTTSTSPLAIGALRSTATEVNGAATWANGASDTFVVNSGTWLWAYCCPGGAVGWPRMYHSVNYDQGVHWSVDVGTGRTSSFPDAWFSTWIR